MIGADANIVGCENAPNSQRAMAQRVEGAHMSALLETALSIIRAGLIPQKDSAI
jgi:hypothetical protein